MTTQRDNRPSPFCLSVRRGAVTVRPRRYTPKLSPDGLELAQAHGPTLGALQGDDYQLEYDSDGYPELPACLDRRPKTERLAA
jgi:hypothetical protein